MKSIRFFHSKTGRLLIGVLVILLLLAISQTSGVNAATFAISNQADVADANPGNGVCQTSVGTCSLRAAIQEANATTSADTLHLPAGIYPINIPPGSGDDVLSGELDITATLTIIGDGPDVTIIDANGLDRILEIHETAGNVTISNLTIRNGSSAADGGGIFITSPGTVRLDNVVITNNHTVMEGGGVYATNGRLIITNSTISGNSARSGGGLYNAGELSPLNIPSRVEIRDSVISGNSADSGGGVYNTHEGTLILTDVTVSGNSSGDYGGGVANDGKTSMTITRGVFTNNQAVSNGGGVYSHSERPLNIIASTFTHNMAGDGDGGEGGGLYTDGSGSVTITGSTFSYNEATGEGGGITFASFGFVTISDSTVSYNRAETGGGINHDGSHIVLSRLNIHHNHATHDGGGLINQGGGTFTLEDSNIYGNQAENGGGMSNDADGTIYVQRSTFWDNRAIVGTSDDTGLGGGIYSLGDAGAVYENVTISGNVAQIRGGALYIDADADVHVINSTLAYNTAPTGSGVADEGTNFNIRYPSTSVIFRNTIVAGNVGGEDCNFPLGSGGGNMDGGTSCGFIGPRDRHNANPKLDAVAFNGGFALTMALQPDSFAIDGGVGGCPMTDARGVTRPQNDKCDIGAYEYEGPFPPPDTNPPDTFFIAGPLDDTENTSLFLFTGLDDVTAPEDLLFECRLMEFDPTEPPEIPDPTQPLPPEFNFVSCSSPWVVPVIEDGIFSFEVRAIDRAGNTDDTPARHDFEVEVDVIPPDTFFLETPPNPSGSNVVFTYSGIDNATPERFLEFECRLDSNDPLAWLECGSLAVYSNLTPGQHTFQVRAADRWDNIDPTPATYTWTVGTPNNCNEANITLLAAADSYVDEALPLTNFGIMVNLLVRSETPGRNARSLLRFELPNGLPACNLERATLRLFGDGDPGRDLEAVPITAPWLQSQVTWNNQPGTAGTPAVVTSGGGYREWNVTDHVTAMIGGAPNYGWIIRDAHEEETAGGGQSYISRESLALPATPPQLVLRFEDAGLPPPPTPPAPVPAFVFCGQTIYESTLVQNDLLNCFGEGLIIGASNIILDLNGHTIASGLPIEPGEEDGLLAGIRNVGNDNVIIRNGTVRNYGYGVRLMAGATNNVVENMNFIGNINAGVELFDADNGRHGNTVRNNLFQHNGFGLVITSGSENSVIENNQFLGNGNLAIYLYDSSGHRIEGNFISGLTSNPLLDSDGGIDLNSSSDNFILNNTLSDTGDAGIILREGSHRNLVQGNSSARASDAGISLNDSDENQVIGNTSHLSGGAAISLGSAHRNLIKDNDVRFNPGGIEIGGSSSHNRIEGNNASYSTADGIVVEGGEDNEIVNNTVNSTQATGIVLEAEEGSSLIEGNTTNDNKDSGISVYGAGHVIANNAAYNNIVWGIEADAGNIDGGGNTASGNGMAAQCTGVVCTPGTAVPPTSADLTPPDTILLTTPPNGSSTMEAAVFTFTGSDNISPPTALRFECRMDAPPDPEPEPPEPGEPIEPPDVDNWIECESPAVFQYLTAGEHTFEVRAIDFNDNIDLTPAVYTWTVVAAPPGADSTPPNTTIFAKPADPTHQTAAVFSFSGSDNSTPGPYLTYQCQLDNGGYAACTSPITYTGLGLGAHTFNVRAIDLQGNVDPTPASHTWTIEPPPPDNDPPLVTITSKPDLMTVNTSATFAFVADEEATFACSLDGEPFTPCDSPITYTGLSVGQHTFTVQATDLAGNGGGDDDESEASYTWTVTPPPVPGTVSCGQVVTQSILLTDDVIGCLEDGLIIGAEGITIDLNGYTLSGTGLGAGILNDGFNYVTVRNGTIHGFSYGVLLNPGTAFNIIEETFISINLESGILLQDADDGLNGNIIRHNELVGNGAGLELIDSAGSTLLGNLVAANMDFGLHMLASDHNHLEDNFIVGSSDVAAILEGSSYNTLLNNTIADNPDGGLELADDSNYNRIEGNYIAESGDSGVIVSLSVGNEIVGNTIREMNDNAIALANAQYNLVYGNDIRFNASGIEISGSSNNHIEANNASSGGLGIEAGDFSYNNVIVLNLVNNNDAGGIAIEGSAPAGYGNYIDRNQANGNGGDGIAVQGVGHIIIGNQANNNDGWGIYSSQGSAEGINIDGGGNLATGNAEPEQCYNVRCDGGPPLVQDAIPPQTLISSGPPNPTVFNTATFDFVGFDNATAVTFQCSLDFAEFTPCATPMTYTGLSLGSHTFAVRARDWSGNVDPSPASYTWTINPLPPGVPPETTIVSGPDVATTSSSATFVFTADEPGVTFECSLDGALATACTSPQSYFGLLPGAHTFAVYAIDSENLPDTTPATHNWFITSTPVAVAASCGQIITQSTLLTNDLLDCLGDGLIIGAHGITLDLNGRTIDGVGLGIGVRNDGFDNVVITNGAITSFDYGVQLNPGTQNNVVSLLTLLENQDGAVQLLGTTNVTVRNNTITGNTMGVELSAGTTGAWIYNNFLLNNPGDAVYLLGVSGNRVEDNQATGSSGAGVNLEGAGNNIVIGNTFVSSSDGGVNMILGSNNNRVEGNTILDSGSSAISISESDGNQVLGNTAHNNGGGGINLEFADNNTIARNDVRFNSGGIALTSSSGNRIEANFASGVGGSGIEVEAESYNNEIVANTVIGNSGEGIYVANVAPAGQGNLIEANIVSSNGGDGISVNGGGHTITNNTADLNGGWGIYAAVTGMDGGGNRALGNDEPTQCFNVVCEIGTWFGQPDTIIVMKPTDPTNSSTAIFTFTGVDDMDDPWNLDFECRLDSSDELAWVECENPWFYTNLSAGEHTFEVRAIDSQGNIDPTPATYTWLYTSLPLGVPPDTFFDRVPPLESPFFEGFFTFYANEPDVTFECSLDGSPFAPCGFEDPEVPVSTGAFIFEFEDYQVGQHTFAVRAIDIEGLVDPTPATYVWNIAGLIVTVTSGPAYIAPEEPGDVAEGGETEETFATFTFVSNLPDTIFYCSLDLEPFAECDPVGTSYTGLAIGEHLFRVYGVDNEGREQLQPTEYGWEIIPGLDIVPPDTFITGGPADPSGSVTFTFTGLDDVTSPAALLFECSLNDPTDAGFSECTSPLTYPNPSFPLPLAIGWHTFYVRAMDAEGNVDPTPAFLEFEFLGDNIAPETTILTGPAAATPEANVFFTFTANDPYPTFECSLDGALYVVCASPYEVQLSEPGTYTLAVRAIDLAGNVGAPASWPWVYQGPPPPDTEAPQTIVVVGPADPSASSQATFIFSGSDNETAPGELEFQCRLDSTDPNAWADCESPATFTGLGLGAHLLEVRAVDLAGNVDETPASHAWTIVLPTAIEPQTGALTSIESGPDPATLSTSATFAFAATNSGASLECSLDGAPFTGCTAPVDYTSLSLGAHVFSVRAGAADTQPSVYVWHVLAAPVPTVVSCGMVLTHSTQLLNDLSNCPYGGLYIGAANIAVDLNGRTVDGLNFMGSGQSSGLHAGITNIGFDNVLIFGGTVQEFGYGILLMTETTNNTVRNATVQTNSIAGVAVADSSNTLLRNNTISGNLEGIWLLNGSGNVVHDNDMDGNLGVPILLENAHNNRVTANVINGETYNPLLGSDAGISLEGSGNNRISGNVINNAGDGGILLIQQSNNNRVENNMANWTGDAGIVIEDSEANLIIGNTAQNNSDAGIGLNHAYLNIIRDNDFRFNPFGIELEDSGGNLIQENNASNNTATGIWIGGTSLQNQVVGNTANNNAAIGIADEAPALDAQGNPAPGNLYDGNTANNNGTHGMYTAEPGHTLQNNTANNNGQWGILAAAGTINGGGNTATGNGFGAQCLGIPCNVPTTFNTPVGPDVNVPLTTADNSASAEVTFSTVSVAGNTTLTVDENPPALPAGYLQLGALFYDINTTAVFSGPIVVCLDYTPGSLPEPVQLLHYEGGAWVDVTTSSSAGQVCGQVSSLSPFAVAALAPPTPPETTITSAPANPSTATTAAFTFTADKVGSTFQCSLDGAPFTACTSPASYTNLALGAHEFRVRATDAEGNVEPTPAGHIWTILAPVDCGAPVVFAVSIDAWVDQGSPTSNKGTDSVMKLQAKGPSNNNRILVRFNLPTSPPPGCQIQSATLRMFAPSAVNGRTLQALRLTGNWTEYGVTWNNQPATAGAAATTSSGQGWREWDVAAQVQAMITSGNHGFLIRDANETGNGFEQQFHAREKNENVPQLVITYAAGGSGGQDIIPPQTSIETGPELTTMDTSASFTFAADEQVVGFECSLNGGPFTGCDTPADYNNLAVANHTFAVRAIDLSGLVDPTPATFYWTVIPTPDTTPPQTNMDSGPVVVTINTNATFTFTADEPGSTFECSSDGVTWTACASPRELTGLALGEHTFQVRATDPAGNTDQTPASHAWTIIAPPDTAVDNAPDATTEAIDATFTFSSPNVTGATFQCALNGAAFTACASPVSYTGLGLGSHTFAVRAIDAYGHADPNPATYTWTIVAPPDTTAPETTITAGPASPTTNTEAEFTFSANEAATFECSLNGAPFTTCTSPTLYSDLNRAAHTFAVRATDQAGNVDDTPASYAWTIEEPAPTDTTPPETLLNSGPEASTSETGATFTFSANEEATFACSLNGAPFTGCTSPATYSGLALGERTFAVQATDTAGNVDATPATYTWVIVAPPDTTPPHTVIEAGPPSSTSATTASFIFSADEPGSTFECSLDGAAWAACVSPKAYSGLAVGEHAFDVRATDPAGNVDPMPAHFVWTVLPPPDTTPPTTTITSGPAASTPSTSASFTFTANESGVTFECSLDGAAFVACATPRAYDSLSAGPHIFAVRGTDPAGNMEAPPVTYNWTVSPPPDCGPQIVANIVADSWVEQGSTSNKGTDGILKVQGKNSNNMRALLRFALPTNVPAGCVVQSAELRLYASSWKNNRTLQVFRLNGNWTEYGVTWANQPGTTGTAVTTTSGSGWRQWNVTAMVQTMLDTGVNHGFLVRDANETGSGNEQQFHAREKGNNIPVLIITLAPAGN
ncbi:MAG: right-handed parallel beta-helix repeat-containing protein [Anaerolineae bacterium]|nr:right-handed parallel beta-helix repeat-containing protein [Anaerolineae bacterium]